MIGPENGPHLLFEVGQPLRRLAERGLALPITPARGAGFCALAIGLPDDSYGDIEALLIVPL